MWNRSVLGARGASILLLAIGVAETVSAVPAQPPALDYTNQNTNTGATPTFMHSVLVTSGGGNIRDDQFADMVSKNVTVYNELAFAFMECTGGGMFDELAAKNFTAAVFQSAARHDQQSIALLGDAPANQNPPAVQSCYNWAYAPQAGSANPVTQRNAAIFARANDYAGILRPNTAIPPAVKEREDPQFLSTGAFGDAITLHRNSGVNTVANNKYLSILYGGANANANDVITNGNGLNTIQNQMTAAGYVNAEVRPLVTGGAAGFRTTFADTAKAWKDVGALSTVNTQVFFWANWGHGTLFEDKVAKKKFQQGQVAPKKGVAFTSAFNDSATALAFFSNFTDTYNFYSGQGATSLLPYFEVYSTLPVSGLSVSINGFSLSSDGSNVQDVYADGTRLEYEYRFGINPSVYSTITSGNSTFLIDYLGGGSANGDLDFLKAGLTLGDAFNGVEVPEPSGCAAIFLSLLALTRRRAEKRSPLPRCGIIEG